MFVIFEGSGNGGGGGDFSIQRAKPLLRPVVSNFGFRLEVASFADVRSDLG